MAHAGQRGLALNSVKEDERVYRQRIERREAGRKG